MDTDARGRARGIPLSQVRATDPDLVYLREFPEVEELHFRETWALTTAGLAHPQTLDNVKRLKLNDTGVTSLEPLRHLTSLEELRVCFTRQPDPDSVRFLRPLRRLKKLTLFSCKLDDEVMPHLAALPALEELDLQNSEITDAGLEHLSWLKTLRRLKVDEEKRRWTLLRRILGR